VLKIGKLTPLGYDSVGVKNRRNRRNICLGSNDLMG
jgi:hypothetical protein